MVSISCRDQVFICGASLLRTFPLSPWSRPDLLFGLQPLNRIKTEKQFIYRVVQVQAAAGRVHEEPADEPQKGPHGDIQKRQGNRIL